MRFCKRLALVFFRIFVTKFVRIPAPYGLAAAVYQGYLVKRAPVIAGCNLLPIQRRFALQIEFSGYEPPIFGRN